MNEILADQISRLQAAIKKEKDPYNKIMELDALRSAFILAEDTESSEQTARLIVTLGTRYVRDNLDPLVLEEVLQKIFEAYVTLAPNDFHSFLMALEWKRAPKERFYQPRIKILRPVVDSMTDMMVHDKYDMMFLSMPPGSGKTTLGLFFLTWLICREPEKCNLAVGYSTPMAKSFFSRIASIETDCEYTLHDIFPKLTRIYTSAKELELDYSNNASSVKKPFVSLTCASVEGSLTGRTRCEGILYCDDLVEGAETAMSPKRLEKLWELYTSNARSRKKEGCKELHIGTRWSLLDPIGKLQLRYKDNPRCLVVSMPALNERGESNFEYDYDVGFSTEMFNDIKALCSTITWSALYMQRPIEAEGLLFPVDSLQRFKLNSLNFKKSQPDDVFSFVDCAFGGGDFLAMPIMAQWGDDPPLLVDVVYSQGSYEKTEPMIVGKIAQWNIHRVVFEANNGGDFMAKDVTDMCRQQGLSCKITTQRAPNRLSKEARIVQHSPAILKFKFMDADDYTDNYMYRNFMENLVTYTAEGNNEHDDAPDSLAGIATMLRCNMRAMIKIRNRRWI